MEGHEQQTATYRISVHGKLDASWADWIGVVHVTHEVGDDGSSVTTLIGEVSDQAALRGLMERIWDLNLTLLSVQRIGPAIARPGGKQK
jgi:hypothetical protein